MRKITLTTITVIFCLNSFAQTGSTCGVAIQEFMISVPCTSIPYTSTTTDKWFSFVATGTYAQITVVSAAFGEVTLSHIHHISLFEVVLKLKYYDKYTYNSGWQETTASETLTFKKK